ncbi:methylamine dehydrogenase accessory protein MauD [Azoarcus sp. TTM-91]|uniref:Methylamine utilization protein MauD n=1 Tax=Azoarcus indigens TaxID=29545 RepID=A0A4R6EEB9_9RHOO|nr:MULTISPECIES: methylamine dehydrogenase accessory protein MauD [Azoarcus]NMG36312.1 methylamine dehydrogenase accessory protein MauD [Azoarcus sp. TTM-91]NMG67070.1 methylamine dehydrogenase accessory protein MauD [Azoarcus indigens]TDN56094.1 methylamine dehydrogenase accessory protein MauD [Azoarcus indigens]
MTEALLVSNIVSWVVILALVLAVLALARQVGILFERVAPMGALMMDTGPKTGDVAPIFSLPTLTGGQVEIGGAAPRSTLLFFLSPTCPVCKKLLPIIKRARKAEGDWLRVVLASDGEEPEHRAFIQRAGLGDFPYLLSQELGMTYHIAKLPYAVLIDEQGRIGAKGLINSREQLESLFTAKELAVGSVQQFIEQKA